MLLKEPSKTAFFGDDPCQQCAAREFRSADMKFRDRQYKASYLSKPFRLINNVTTLAAAPIAQSHQQMRATMFTRGSFLPQEAI